MYSGIFALATAYFLWYYCIRQGGTNGLDLAIRGIHPGEGPTGTPVPIRGVATVRLDHVDDPVQPRTEGARIGLGNGVGAVPVAGFQKLKTAE
ncbi:MAG TPA: hypothetical protein VF464_06625 [Candidatus Methylomirabilis sp.]